MVDLRTEGSAVEIAEVLYVLLTIVGFAHLKRSKADTKDVPPVDNSESVRPL